MLRAEIASPKGLPELLPKHGVLDGMTHIMICRFSKEVNLNSRYVPRPRAWREIFKRGKRK